MSELKRNQCLLRDFLLFEQVDNLLTWKPGKGKTLGRVRILKYLLKWGDRYIIDRWQIKRTR